MKFKSHATWPPETGVTHSDDNHPTAEHAQAVCDRLVKEGFGGDGMVFPIKTWVEKIPETSADELMLEDERTIDRLKQRFK